MHDIKLKFLHVSENAFFSEDKKLNVIGIFERINSAKFPAMHPIFTISLGITGDKGKHKLLFEILSPPPDNKKLIDFKRELLIKESGGGSNYILKVVGFIFPKEGKYQIKVKVDDILSNEENYIILEKEDEK